jgi:hypothetical protein
MEWYPAVRFTTDIVDFVDTSVTGSRDCHRYGDDARYLIRKS